MKENSNLFKQVSSIALASTMVVSIFSGMQFSKAATTFSMTNKVTIGKGETFQLSTKGASRKISFRSSNNKIVSVTKSGKITGKKVGKVIITAKSNKKTRKCKITVKSSPKKISFSQPELILLPNTTKKLTVTISSGYSNQITYQSENSTVASVSDNGLVTAKAVGKTTIKANTFNGKTATIRCIVTNGSSSTTTTQAKVRSAIISKIKNGTIYIDKNRTSLDLSSCITYYKTCFDGTPYAITKEELLPGDTIEITYSGAISNSDPVSILTACEQIVVTNTIANAVIEDNISNITERNLELTNHKDAKFYFDTDTTFYKKGQEITIKQIHKDDIVRICAYKPNIKGDFSTMSMDSYVGYARTVVVLDNSVEDLQ